MKFNLSLFLLLIIAFFTACTKIETTNIGNGLIPPVDGVITKDTFINVLAKNAGDSTIRVGISDEHVTGYINDPLFGKTTAAINVELKPASFPYSFEVGKDSLHLDSVVLVLSYKGAWGDTSQNLALRVLQINPASKMKPDTVYANTHIVTATNLLSESVPAIINIDKLSDSIHYFHEDAANQIRIRLKPSLGEQLLNIFDSTDAYLNDSIFSERFSGFQIAADPVGNSLLRVNLLDTNTKLALYYKYDRRDSGDKQDTSVRYFRAEGFNNLPPAHSNYIKRERTSPAQIANFYPSPPSKLNDSLLFLQTGPGVYTTIIIPLLSSFPNVIVHRAELIMDQVPDLTTISDQYFTPPFLFLAAYSDDSSRRFAFSNDVQFNNNVVSNLVEFGSVPYKQVDALGKTYNTYHFNISRYIQGIVTKKNKDYKLVVYAPFNDYIYPIEATNIQVPITSSSLNPPAVGRVRLNGGGDYRSNPHAMRLHIIYSLIQ